MKQSRIAGNMDTKLKRIASLTCEKPELKFNGLMTYFNKEFLIRCFHELDGKKAVGVDGRAKDDYEEIWKRMVTHPLFYFVVNPVKSCE